MPAVDVPPSHTTLSQHVLGNLVSLYDTGDFQRAEPLTAPGARTTYKVTTSTGVFMLVVHEDRPFWDLVHEKDLVLFLTPSLANKTGVQVAVPMTNVAGGYFFPVDPQRYAWLCRGFVGRPLGVFEVDDGVCHQVGTFLAHFHREASAFHGQRSHQSHARGRSPLLRPRLHCERDSRAYHASHQQGRHQAPTRAKPNGFEPRQHRQEQNGRRAKLQQAERIQPSPPRVVPGSEYVARKCNRARHGE